ncbi:MED6-domain-containing protein [Dacryopinax primogenitus]|uniref:Mediator of RNA polymerase II transcription subunit 6 n=1 Tax=Dacryopinax primogenitus (strain DJM 731) TaxID=1858805 RepID=M5FXC3_DACPD|nr:MED6-domain-containing protein [Dacryopinax primogenitus]EJU01109.1 MED6-domain-containing protein [Dacryopinax primogenitus]
MSAPSEDELLTTSWLFSEWIAAFGPLTHAQKALDYFSLSIFWDKQSTNQVLRMQTQHALGPDGLGGSGVDEESELRKFTGVEFAVVHGRPPGLWVIHKRERFSPDEVRPLAAYFILNNTIYPSPSLYSVLSTSLSTTLHHLSASLALLRAQKPAYNPRVGTSWPIAPPRDPTRSLAAGRSRAGSVIPEEGGSVEPRAGGETVERKKEEEVVPLWHAFLTASSYAQAAAVTRESVVLTPEDEDSPLEEPARERGGTRERERESATPAPLPTGGKRHSSGGKVKRRKKSRALSAMNVPPGEREGWMESPLRGELPLAE